ncbi:paralemmin-3 isoform X2 [Vombatus ursinus]|uniref:Paralemmin 3 n=1 Tax=Vombatus ursinus TaxID=29139 RepID=A0A4X2M606_VOMUR|nr:paralemmin-3 isoform X2 [Vombatus ursinus]
MALQSQGLPPSGWTPANPMPMVESALYRQRLEVIAEKRRLQEQICGARRELEEEKLKVQRLKRKSLRERWLMDGTAEAPEGAEPEADPHSPQGQAQARIQRLEDSLFTLQSQLQLLQSASTGAQHKTSAWPTWRLQVSRSLSQTAMEPGPEGKEDLEKRASLPLMPAVSMPDPSTSRIPKELGGEAATTSQAPKEEEVSTADTVEVNGPCPAPVSVELELTQNQVDAAEDRGPGAGDGVDSSRGTVLGPGIVKVEWDGLRFLEESAREAPTCTERGKVKEQEVEEIVLEVIGDHQVTRDPELPEWMTKDRRVQEVEEMVLEAMKNRSMVEAPELPEWVTKDRGIVEVVWEGLGGTNGSDMGDSEGMAREEAAAGSPASSGLESKEHGPGGSPELGDQGEGSFIWVERVLITEDWEEVLVEESEGTAKESKEGEAGESLQHGGEEEGEKGHLGTEKGGEEKHLETKKLGSEGETEEVFQKGGRREVHVGAEEVKEDEEQLGEEKEGEGKEQLEGGEKAGGEKQLEAEEKAGGEKLLGGEEEEEGEQPGSKEEEEKEREGGVEKEMPAEKGPEEKGPDSEETEKQEQEMKQVTQPEAGPEPQAEEATSAPGEPQPPAPSLEQLPAPEAGPAERQPLLQPATRTVNPASRPVPTYAPAQRPEPQPDSEQASGSKQTCQCCIVM